MTDDPSTHDGGASQGLYAQAKELIQGKWLGVIFTVFGLSSMHFAAFISTFKVRVFPLVDAYALADFFSTIVFNLLLAVLAARLVLILINSLFGARAYMQRRRLSTNKENPSIDLKMYDDFNNSITAFLAYSFVFFVIVYADALIGFCLLVVIMLGSFHVLVVGRPRFVNSASSKLKVRGVLVTTLVLTSVILAVFRSNNITSELFMMDIQLGGGTVNGAVFLKTAHGALVYTKDGDPVFLPWTAIRSIKPSKPSD